MAGLKSPIRDSFETGGNSELNVNFMPASRFVRRDASYFSLRYRSRRQDELYMYTLSDAGGLTPVGSVFARLYSYISQADPIS